MQFRFPSKLFCELSALLLITVLAGCAALTPEDSESYQAEQERRAQLLAARGESLKEIQRWQMNARFSLVTDNEAWNGKLFWSQESDNIFYIQFSDPTGQGVMQLTGNEMSVQLELANGKSYQASDADTLLRQETDWDLPLKSLWFWIRGVPDPQLPLRSELNEQGLPVMLAQDEWNIECLSYDQVANRAFPRKISIHKGAIKLKIIVMNWTLE